MSEKRRSYEARFKLQVIAFAEEKGNRAAERKFSVSEKLVRDWRKQKSKLKKMPQKRRADRPGGKPHWPELEAQLVSWIQENRNNGIGLCGSMVRLKAKLFAKEMDIDRFTGNPTWLYRFMRRNDLVLRQKTRLSQRLPEEFEDKIIAFQRAIICTKKAKQYSLEQIGNMDETPMQFDMPLDRTLNNKGDKTITIKTTGHEKDHFTVVLACLADGTRLKPMVIFKRKRMPKDPIPAGIVLHYHERGWMDEEGMKLWVRKVWCTRSGGLLKKPSLLVYDSFRGHLVPSVQKRIAEANTDTCVIPGGLTSQLQPLDVCLNKPFKQRVRMKWTECLMDKDKHSFTRSGYMRKPTSPQCVHGSKKYGMI